MEEIWKDIIIEKKGTVYDYTGLYQVSNLGKVRNSRTGRILKPATNGAGYQDVGLYKDKKEKKFLIHRLVATAFIPNPDNLPVVNHRDENQLNNHVDNLEWCTQKENVNYGTSRKRASEAQKGRTFTDEHKQKLKNNHADRTGDKNPNARKVICLETKQVFACIKEAKLWLGKKGISGCCRGIRKTAGGYHWMYYEDWLAMTN